MLKHPVDRSRGESTAIPKYIRRQIVRQNCQICLHRYNQVFVEADCLSHEVRKIHFPRQIIHHLIPRRWLNEHNYFEHHTSNLLSICMRCHSKFQSAEDRLYQGDLIGFLTRNKQCGIDPQRIIKFALSIGLKEFEKVNV
jgi:hypothetical protein